MEIAIKFTIIGVIVLIAFYSLIPITSIERK